MQPFGAHTAASQGPGRHATVWVPNGCTPTKNKDVATVWVPNGCKFGARTNATVWGPNGCIRQGPNGMQSFGPQTVEPPRETKIGLGRKRLQRNGLADALLGLATIDFAWYIPNFCDATVWQMASSGSGAPGAKPLHLLQMQSFGGNPVAMQPFRAQTVAPQPFRAQTVAYEF